MRQFWILLAVLIVLDGLWLGLLMRDFYRDGLAHLARMADGRLDPIWPVAVLVYPVIALGLAVFALPRAATASEALLYGALFGALTYAVYDLTNRPQIPTWQHLPRGGYRNDGAVAHWRAILDDDERVMVMITFNNDVADGWQRADEYDYPQEAANLAISLGVNFAVYALSH